MHAPKGLTLLEVMVSMGIASVVFAILGGIFLAQGRFFAIQDAVSETQVHAFRAVDATGLFMNSAKRVMASQNINGTAYSTTSTMVVLELPSITASGGLIGNTFDYVAIGLESATSTLFVYDLQAGAGSDRQPGKFTMAQFVDKVIFRYNTVTPADASSIDLYVRTMKEARGSTIYAPLGKIFYLGAF
jgi:prepilin-type N-terminal cleavage/methylation domain-containing protein